MIASVRDAFLDVGVDKQVGLQDLKQLWLNKLISRKAVVNPDRPEPQSPVLTTYTNISSNKVASIGNNRNF